MQVFYHHVYEYKRGLRDLILYTTAKDCISAIEKKLKSEDISYIIYFVNHRKINVFFGNPACIQVIQRINKSSLLDYTPEEDFILGIMLGYCRKKQCDRYLELTKAKQQENRSKGKSFSSLAG